MQDLLKDHRLYHSEFQQDYFITKRSGGTIYGQYKQALREVYKRFRGLKEIKYQKDSLQIDIDEMVHRIEHDQFSNEFDHRRDLLKHDKYQLDMIELDKNLEDTEREFKRFYQHAISLKALVGELTDERRNQLDKEMWIYKLKEMVAVDFISSGRMKNNTVELINSLEKSDRFEILKLSKEPDKLLEWYENKECNYDLLSMKVDVKKLLE